MRCCKLGLIIWEGLKMLIELINKELEPAQVYYDSSNMTFYIAHTEQALQSRTWAKDAGNDDNLIQHMSDIELNLQYIQSLIVNNHLDNLIELEYIKILADEAYYHGLFENGHKFYRGYLNPLNDYSNFNFTVIQKCILLGLVYFTNAIHRKDAIVNKWNHMYLSLKKSQGIDEEYFDNEVITELSNKGFRFLSYYNTLHNFFIANDITYPKAYNGRKRVILNEMETREFNTNFIAQYINSPTTLLRRNSNLDDYARKLIDALNDARDAEYTKTQNSEHQSKGMQTKSKWKKIRFEKAFFSNLKLHLQHLLDAKTKT